MFASAAFMYAVLSLAAAGLGLLLIGLRGKRTDNHPLCRKCGFDLSGLLTTPPASTTPAPGTALPARCPECGRDIRHGRIRIGHRKRLTWLIASGAAATVAGLLLAFTGLFLRNADGAVYAKLPTPLLSWIAPRLEGNKQLKLLPELLKRAKSPTLSASEAHALMHAALLAQADESQAWITQWGDLAEELIAAGKANDEEILTYLRQSVTAQLILRRIGRVGDPTGIGMRTFCVRRGSKSLDYQATVKSISVGGSVDTYPSNWTWTGGMSEGLTTTFPTVEGEAGPRNVKVELTIRADTSNKLLPAPPSPTWSVTLNGVLPVVARGQQIVKFVDDPALGRQILEHLKFRIGGRTTVPELEITPGTTIPFAFMAFARTSDGRLIQLHTIAYTPSPLGQIFGIALYWDQHGEIRADRLDLILRADEGAAISNLDATEVWGGQIVIPDIPVPPYPKPGEPYRWETHDFPLTNARVEPRPQ